MSSLYNHATAQSDNSNLTGLERQIQNLYDWADRKIRIKANHYIASINHGQVLRPTSQRQAENEKTIELYRQTFSTFLWTGLECSNPESLDKGRWDQLELAGVYDPHLRKRQANLLLELGISNLRMGIPNHRIHQPIDWQLFTDILTDFKKVGANISLDLLHFGLPSRFRNDERPEESIFLNPAWPDYYVDFAMTALRLYRPYLQAVTLINEPLITNNFSAGLWNEAMPGTWPHPLYNHYFIKRALLLAKAAVTARHQIEVYLQSLPDEQQRRLVFIHNESCEFRSYDTDFNLYHRFLTSDLILGHDWLLHEAYRETGMFHWILEHYARPDHMDEDTRWLVETLDTLKNSHLNFQAEFGKTMRADTVFGIDYYLACESFKHGFEYELPVDLTHYEEGVKSGVRKGLLRMAIEYWNRYQLPILHTETNFADVLSAEWGTIQLLELVQLHNLEIPVLGFTWYSLMDQFNWDTRLCDSPQQTRVYPVGLVSLPDYGFNRFAREVLPALETALQTA